MPLLSEEQNLPVQNRDFTIQVPENVLRNCKMPATRCIPVSQRHQIASAAKSSTRHSRTWKPRITCRPSPHTSCTVRSFLHYSWHSLTLKGRVSAVRKSGSRLVFIDIVQDGHRAQALCSLRKLETPEGTSDAFRRCFQSLRRGDHLSVSSSRPGTN